MADQTEPKLTWPNLGQQNLTRTHHYLQHKYLLIFLKDDALPASFLQDRQVYNYIASAR